MAFDGTASIPLYRLSKKSLLVVIVLAALLFALFLGEQIYLSAIERNWQKRSADGERELAEYIQAEFSSYEQEALSSVEAVANLPELQSSTGNEADTRRNFEILLAHKLPDLSLEQFDAQKRLISWAGTRGPSIDTGRLGPQPASFVLDGAIYSYLVVTVPIMVDRSAAGFLVGKSLFEVNYPVNNRFINNSAFASTFTSRLKIAPEFDFSPRAAPVNDDRLLSIPLHVSDGKPVGFAYVQRPNLAARLEDARALFQHGIDLLLIGIMVVLLYRIITWAQRNRRAYLKIVVWSIAIWFLRYAFVWTGFPEQFVKLTVFDPHFFASSFGYGIARSIGDLFISSVFLCSNIVMVISTVFAGRLRGMNLNNARWPKKMSLALSVVILAMLLCFLLRGFSAMVQSAVFDSALAYNDPTSVIPSFELGVMLLSLALIAVSLVIAAVAIILFARSLAVPLFTRLKGGSMAWLFVGVVFLSASGVFSVIQDHPLMDVTEGLVYVAGFVLLGVAADRRFAGEARLFAPATVIPVILAAVVVLVPVVDKNAHALDRSRVELLGAAIAQPTDSWLTLIVNQALDELSNEETASVIAAGDSGEVSKLAFTRWAKSILSKEGNNCLVTYVDSGGVLLSDFHIGITPTDVSRRRASILSSPRSVHVEEKSVDGSIMKFYIGHAPVLDANGNVVAGVRIEVSGSKEAMVRDETPEILRSYEREEFETRYRNLFLSEYFQGKSVSTSNENIPLGRSQPPNVRIEKVDHAGMWMDEEIEGKQYETYYLAELSGHPGESWIALSMETLDFKWHVYSFLRYVLFYFFLGAGVFSILLVVRVARGRRVARSFRAKLMAAFIVVSLIPVGILAYYNREYAFKQAEDLTVNRLNDQTSIVAAEIQRQLGNNVPVTVSTLTDELCADIAADLNTDFNVYLGAMLQASSKPEMFAAELLDPTLSAESYLNVVLKKKAFFAENQVIGKLPYVVGYRPLVAENGSITGVVAVPTLYQQTEVNEELTRRNVFLFGAYAFAIAISLVVGSAFANQISSPIRRLKNATRQVGGGKLEVNLQHQRQDELGELEQAFQEMTLDLKRTQDEMIRAQRESAWREMAKQVAHEIKNPLTPIKLSIQHLRQAYRDGVKDFDAILQSVSETILEQIDALSRIASEFSHFARMPERQLEPSNIHDVLQEAVNLYSQNKHTKILMRLDSGSPVVNADREELRRVFINIIRNALQAMEEKGTISIVTRADQGFVEIQVADDGPGIPVEVQNRLFEPNFSTKTDGMGLGLAIVKKIIDDLGGNISIASAVGKGTTVTIRLPIS